MRHTKAMRQKFVEMRAAGLSFEKISAAIGVSKQTLLRWQVEMEADISTCEYFDRQALLEQHRLDQRARIEEAAIRLEKIREAIKARDFGKMDLKDLLSMEKRCEERLSAELTRITAYSGYTRNHNEERRYSVLTDEKKLRLTIPSLDNKQ